MKRLIFCLFVCLLSRHTFCDLCQKFVFFWNSVFAFFSLNNRNYICQNVSFNYISRETKHAHTLLSIDEYILNTIVFKEIDNNFNSFGGHLYT